MIRRCHLDYGPMSVENDPDCGSSNNFPDFNLPQSTRNSSSAASRIVPSFSRHIDTAVSPRLTPRGSGAAGSSNWRATSHPSSCVGSIGGKQVDDFINDGPTTYEKSRRHLIAHPPRRPSRYFASNRKHKDYFHQPLGVQMSPSRPYAKQWQAEFIGQSGVEPFAGMCAALVLLLELSPR